MTDAVEADRPTRGRLVAGTVAVAFFIQMLDGTIIVTALPQMAASFGTDPVSVGSGLTVYMLAAAVLMPPAAWLADRFGAKAVFLAAIALFTVASLACALSRDLATFVAFRAAQGAGAALMTPVGRLIVIRDAPKSELVRAIAAITWPALFAPVVGPVLGGWITSHAGWQWNFLLNLPLGALGIGLVLAFVPSDGPRRAPAFDWAGLALTAGSLTLLMTGLELFAGGHGSASLAAGLGAAGAVLAVAAVDHLRAADAPLIDLSVLEARTFSIATFGAGTLGRIAINATPFLLPLLFQVGFGRSAVETGTLLLVYFLGNLAMKAVTTPLLRRFGFRRVVVVNGLVSAAAIGSFGCVAADTPTPLVLALLALAGLSRSLQFTALNTLAFADVEAHQRGAASTLSSILQQLAMVLGIAMSVAAIRIAQSVRGTAGDEAAAADIQAAFLAVGVVAFISAWRCLALSADAGRDVSRHGD